MDLSLAVKRSPADFASALAQKTLLMLFEKPSLRTRLSFEASMTQLGGHAIYYSVQDSPLGRKENLSDTANCASRFADVIMARVRRFEDVEELAATATVPTINALDNRGHPCQVIADAVTIVEKLGRERAVVAEAQHRLRLVFLGDGENNMAYALMRLCALMGWHGVVAAPEGAHSPLPEVMDAIVRLAEKTGGTVAVSHDAEAAVRGADVVYTDSWLSYGVPEAEKAEREAVFAPFRVTEALMDLAKPDAIFMNCLPAQRGMEQTAEVIDGKRSVVFDQAENRLHAQKALLLLLLRGSKYASRMSSSVSTTPAGPVVVAVGGNALEAEAGGNAAERLALAAEGTANDVVQVDAPHGLLVVHGNGPQVGALLDMHQGSAPLSSCVAETQGQIGAALQRALSIAQGRHGRHEAAVSLVTHVTVDGDDAAFGNPTKPVGGYLDDSAAEAAKAAGHPLVHETGKPGPRRVDTFTGRASTFRPVDAVIDKDLVASLLAQRTNASAFVILTDVDGVLGDFGSKTEHLLPSLTVSEAESMLPSLAKGSMAPKVAACAAFVRATGRPAFIGRLGALASVLAGQSGTKFCR